MSRCSHNYHNVYDISSLLSLLCTLGFDTWDCCDFIYIKWLIQLRAYLCASSIVTGLFIWKIYKYKAEQKKLNHVKVGATAVAVTHTKKRE